VLLNPAGGGNFLTSFGMGLAIEQTPTGPGHSFASNIGDVVPELIQPAPPRHNASETAAIPIWRLPATIAPSVPGIWQTLPKISAGAMVPKSRAQANAVQPIWGTWAIALANPPSIKLR
jgi:hypothetical protein